MKIKFPISYFVAKRVFVQLEKLSDKINVWHVVLVSLIFSILAIVGLKGGAVHWEIYSYLPNYLADRSLVSKLFDSNIFDNGYYQARELSYLFDYFDSNFVALTVCLGSPQFISITHYVFSTLISVILWWFSVKELKLRPIIGMALVLLYWTTPSVFLSGLFRSAKIGVALAVALVFFMLYRAIKKELDCKEHVVSTAELMFCSLVSIAAMLFDRQGVFLMFIALVFLIFWYRFFRTINTVKFIVVFACTMLLSYIYNHYIATNLTLHFNNYWPKFAFQDFGISQCLYDMEYYHGGIVPFIHTVGFLLGDMPYEVTFIVLSVSFFLLVYELTTTVKEKKYDKLFVVTVISFIIVHLLIFLMLAIMSFKHPPILWTDVIRVYYWLPILPLICMTLAMVLAKLKEHVSQRVIFAFMLIAIISNICAIPRHRDIQHKGHMKPCYDIASKVRETIKTIRTGKYKSLPADEKNQVYQCFLKKYPVKEVSR